MPVLITGAAGLVGRALAHRLLGEGAEVRAYIRSNDAGLRTMGAHVAVGDVMNVERLESALTRVHTIVHLVGGAWPGRGVSYDALNRETTECAAIAARAAGVTRFVFLSFPHADPGSTNAFLASKGAAEAHVLDAGLEHVVLRSPPVAEWLEARGVRAAGAIRLEEVVDALVAADARDTPLHGTWALPAAPPPDVPAKLWGRPPRELTDAFARVAEDRVPAWT